MDSVILQNLNRLDIGESARNALNGSYIISCLNKFLELVQNKASVYAEGSIILKNIDNILLSILTLMLTAIIFTSTGVIGLLSASAFIFLTVKFLFVKGQRIDFTGFELPVLLYMLIAGISVSFSSLFLPSLKGFIKMLIYFGTYVTFLHVFRNNPKRMIYILGVLTIAGSIEAFYAMYQQLVGVEPLASWQDMTDVNPEQLMNRVYGTLKPFNPNLLAGYLVAVFSPILGMAFWLVNRGKKLYSILAFAGASAVLLSIICTGSRGAYIASFAMLASIFLVSGHIIWRSYGHIKWLKKLWLGIIIFGLIGAVLAVILSPALQHRVFSIFLLRGDSSNSYRLNVYAACLKIFADNWLIGIGPGNTTFRLVYGYYMVTGFDALGAYSIPLETAVECGIFGLMAFLWIILL